METYKIQMKTLKSSDNTSLPCIPHLKSVGIYVKILVTLY